jgi:hypothetical protein
MLPLLVITALLLLTAGLVEAKAASRVGMGLPLLALADIVAGVGLVGAVFAVDLTRAQGLAVLVGAVMLVLVSSLQVGAQVRRRQRIRAASEGARLATYVNFRRGAGGGGDPGPERGPGARQPEQTK